VAGEGKTGVDMGWLGTPRVAVEMATWSGCGVVTEATVGEESGVGNGRDDKHAASVRPKPTMLNRLAKSNLIMTDRLRNGSPFSLRTAFPQTAGQHLPRRLNMAGAIVALSLPQ